jgi:hypothetical protein
VVGPEYWDNIGQPIARSLSRLVISTLFMKKNRSIMLNSKLGHIAENEILMRDLPTIIDVMYNWVSGLLMASIGIWTYCTELAAARTQRTTRTSPPDHLAKQPPRHLAKQPLGHLEAISAQMMTAHDQQE